MSFVSRVLPTNHFVRGVSVLIGGTIGAQSIMILAAPVLTRLYTPKEFGFLAVFAALLSVIAVIASLRYEQAIPLSDNDHDAAALLVLSLLTVLAVVIFSAFPIILYRHEIAELLNTPELADYLYLVLLGALFAGAYNVLNYWAIRMKAFTPLAKTKIGQSIAAVGIQIGGAPLGPIALMFGQIAGQASGLISLSVRLLRQQRTLITTVRPVDLVVVACRYKQFPLFGTFGALFNTIGGQLPSILFAALFSPSIAGIYLLANRVIEMPMQLLGFATANVFLSDAAQAYREGKLGPMVARIHDRLAHIGMPPALVLLLAGPDIFRQIFGMEWREAGVFAQWLAPCLYLAFLASPLSSVFGIVNRQATGMLFQIVLVAVNLAAITVGAWAGNLLLAVGLLALGNAAFQIARLVWIIRISGNSWRDTWHPTVTAFTWGTALVSPIILATWWKNIDQSIWFLAFAVASALIAARYAYLIKEAWQ